MKCNQTDCQNPATFLYTWPGHNQAGTCDEHGHKLQAVAHEMGWYLQLIPVESSEGEKDTTG